MSYMTVEVELERGQVRPRGSEPLPEHAHALLTILERGVARARPPAGAGAGLRRFLATPDFPLTLEQFRASMEADVFEQ